MENRAAYNQTTQSKASRHLPPVLLRCFPAGSGRPGPAREHSSAYKQTTQPATFRYLSTFFSRCFLAGSQRPGPAREHSSAYKQTTQPDASHYLPTFFLSGFPAGSRWPGPAGEHSSAYKQSTRPEAKTPCPPLFCFRFFLAGSRRPGPAMDGSSVYNPTTEPEAKRPRRLPLGCTLRHLRKWRLSIKVFQTIFSLVAVVCEELVEECYNCSALYFFEFVSCSAFLLSLLILYMHCTDLYESLGEDKVQKLNFWAVPVIGVCFLSSSVLLSATCNEPEEYAACVFGFFASCAFAAEFVVELCLRLKQKWNRDGRPEKPRNTRSATENQPLNKQR